MLLTGNTILITGGTSGIGRALAETFYRRGNQVIIAGRRQALIDEIVAANPGMRGLPLDVQDPSAIDAFAAEIREAFPNLNVLINNAGISKAENLAKDAPDISVSLSIIQTNIVSVLSLTAALLPVLKRQEQSTIITTTSGLAFVPFAPFPTYCASKAFLHSWLQSLRFQLRATSVEVLELAPPYVQTELAGPQQSTDPHAMPLADYINGVMQLLGNPDQPHGEILVERVKALRWAERGGNYEQIFEANNNR
ncbi:SDR family oxidoreductase [Rhizobium leguminosarum]|uniref:SDR family oxidoreductase n=1 Tax=Rhizobium leguminosarum TaxID=384 RepID=UPI001C9553ED|nr:SDR family NAD(P)-dependent oxidoreductase [Rhizobium leguminosarum]MBY5666326.1 SDR family NAD(P)-dependent oxidoreductase [Rhizobium leguminosarum]MBY5679914.1 SDR family NAD(P)-dependent oxidoreductase [Rhizobium leguminosarum]